MLGHGGSQKGYDEGICFGKEEQGTAEQPLAFAAPSATLQMRSARSPGPALLLSYRF